MSLSPISRRSFLRTGSAVSAGLVLPFHSISSVPGRRTNASKKVLILGAGMAGLSAGIALKKEGHEVILLEAQGKAGGRVLTAREPFATGLLDDMGAARLPDNHERVQELIRHYQLKTKAFYPNKGKELYQIDGQMFLAEFGSEMQDLFDAFPLEPSERKMGMEGIFEKTLGPAMSSMGDPWQADWPSKDLLAYDAFSPNEYFADQGFSDAVAKLFSMGWAEKGRGGIDVSMLWLARQLYWESTEKTRVKIEGGNDLLPKAMAHDLWEEIHFGRVVEAIGQSEAGVYAIAQGPGGTQNYSADYLICTIPFSVLKDLEVTPGFSPRKQEVIDNLTYESLSRVVFQCRRPIWSDQQKITGFARTDFPVEIWHSNWNYMEQDRAMLHVYVKARQSRKIAAMSEMERQRYLLDYLETLYPGLKDEVEVGFSKCWENDPYAKGAHVFPKSGEMEALFADIGTPEGRIFFAGEHASPVQGWIEGAIWSGRKAAKDILETAAATAGK